MEVIKSEDRAKLNRAKKRIEELKGYYWHLGAYIVVNTFITISKIIRNLNNGESFWEAFWDFGTFTIWFFWGIGLAFHTLKVFSFISVLGKNWEEQQIQKFIEEEKKAAEKYK